MGEKLIFGEFSEFQSAVLKEVRLGFKLPFQYLVLIVSPIEGSRGLKTFWNASFDAKQQALKRILSATSLTSGTDRKTNVKYFILDTNLLIDCFAQFIEHILLYDFISLVAIKDAEINQILSELSRFSLFGVFSTRRWNKIALWHLFLDVEHFGLSLKSFE